MIKILFKPLAVWLFIIQLLITQPANAADSVVSCLQQSVLSADDSISVGELREQCNLQLDLRVDNTIVQERKRRQMSLFGDEFSILLHRDNYLLPLTHNRRNTQPSLAINEAIEFDDLELKFQVSIKTMLLSNLPLFRGQLFAAYTNQSHWQAFNSKASRPFRETNHQPELFVDFPASWQYGNWQLNTLRFGLNHHSNGQTGDISRSWNRAFGELEFSSEHSEVSLRTWWQVEDDEDNPDITRFMGNFQLNGLHKMEKHQFQWGLRKSFEDGGKGAFELGWSRRIGGREDLRMFIQYFEGYGESLIDYNRNIQRIGVGFKVGAN